MYHHIACKSLIYIVNLQIMKPQHTILIVDDEPSMRLNLRELLGDEGYEIAEAANGEEAVRIVKKKPPSVILMDIKMPKMDGLRALRMIKKFSPDTPVIIFTAFGTNEKPIETMKAGAYDYLEKPFDVDELLNVLKGAIKESQSVADEKKKGEKPDQNAHFEEHIVANSKKMKSLLKLIGKVAAKDTTVLLQGESGTGKEVIADAIHRHSYRAEGPYVKVNCGALPESLLESELFGHEAGSFTGATRQRLGRFELADGGTIFLDEVDALTLPMQIKLLRVLQQFTFERIGGEKTIRTNVRIIAATNTNLSEKIREGKFREDLYYRLNIIHINIPPLRKRKSDIEPLTNHFLNKYFPEDNMTISKNALDTLHIYNWPGNIRELENVIQRAAVLAQGNTIHKNDLSLPAESLNQRIETTAQTIKDNADIPFHEIVGNVEKDLIYTALKRSGWNKSEAAKLLRINRRLLYSKMDQYNIGNMDVES